MIDFHDVMKRIKKIISKQINKQKILDRDIANSLGLNPQYYAVIKKRKKYLMNI